jgi:methylase of polypeptide subunit release factors
MNDVGEFFALDRTLGRESRPYGRWRGWLRRIIHFFCYHLILKSRATRVTRTAGFHLIVRPTVFHPACFVTSKYFASFIGGLDLTGLRVADVGTGSGILALAAARAGAAHVTAIDINPNAVLSAADNARVNGHADRFTAICSNLLSAVAPVAQFDLIISSPPSFAGEPRDVADRAWHAGPDYRDVAALFDQARERLAPHGRMYLLVSSDSDLALFGRLIERAGFRVREAARRSILIEALIIYELAPIAQSAPGNPYGLDSDAHGSSVPSSLRPLEETR